MKNGMWLSRDLSITKVNIVNSLQTLANLHGNGDAQHPKVLAEFKEIQGAIQFDREHAVSSYRALVEPKMFKRVILGMSVQMWSQLCGMNSKSELCHLADSC